MCADLDKETSTLTQTLKERQEIMEKLKDLAAKQKIFLDLGGSNMI
jgi:methanogenic corrinoid protein MtbC1